MTNKEEIFDLLQQHPEGFDDDDITRMTGIQSRQQVQQLCNQLANSQRIERRSVEKIGKRKKIHNFPIDHAVVTGEAGKDLQSWKRRLSALVAATSRSESDILNEALQLFAMKILRDHEPRSAGPVAE